MNLPSVWGPSCSALARGRQNTPCVCCRSADFAAWRGRAEKRRTTGEPKPHNPRAFTSKPVWKRILIICAGAAMNLLLGLILIGGLTLSQDLVGTNQVARFSEGAVSSTTGLQEGDKILRVNGKRVLSSSDITYLVARDGDGTVDFTVERGGETVELPNVRFATEDRDGQTVIRFDFSIIGEPKSFGNVLKNTFTETASMARLVWLSLFDLVTGHYGLSDLAGPVGTVSVIAQAASVDISGAINLMAMITVNIGIFNLLPIPALDGGKLIFLIVEGIRRKPVNPKYEGWVTAAGFVILFGFMIILFFQDILHLIRT
ncbi:MAG: M50 family metallopeptidase [Clostridia bacterium]